MVAEGGLREAPAERSHGPLGRRRQRIWVLTLVAVVIGAVACQGSPATSGATTTASEQLSAAASVHPSGPVLDLATASRTLAALTAPVDSAIARLRASLLKLSDDETGRDLANLTAPTATAVEAFDNAALATQWPPGARTSIVSLVTLNVTLIDDLRQAEQQDPQTIATWEFELGQDVAKTQSTAEAIQDALTKAAAITGSAAPGTATAAASS